jgi:hypothetical protein
MIQLSDIGKIENTRLHQLVIKFREVMIRRDFCLSSDGEQNPSFARVMWNSIERVRKKEWAWDLSILSN